MKNIEEIIEENKNLIYSIASKYSNYYNIEDLFQVGSIGLLKAYKNYNMTSNAKFLTYAYKYILGEIIEYIKNDRTMRVSDEYMKIYKSYEKTKDFLTNELNREPSLIEISKFMNIDTLFLENIINTCLFTSSLDASLNEDDFSLENTIGIDNSNVVDDILDLKKEVQTLPENERKIIELRYFKDYTQAETAQILGMTQVQVSRSENSILRKIKYKINV